MTNANMESVELDEQPQPVSKTSGWARYPFPAVTVGVQGSAKQAQISFNRYCTPILNDIDAFAIRFTPNYIVFTPACAASQRAVACRRHPRTGRRQLGIPAALRAMKLKPGARKLLRCKDGFAISRYEILE